MYQVVLINNGIETVIHHSTADEQAPHLASMNLQMFENQSNIFNFVIYKHYSGYDDIVDLATQIKIFDLQNGKIKYEGRILVATENMDSEGKFYKDVTCESELAYLNDSLVGRWELHPSTLPEDSVSYAEPNHTILTALTKIIDNHNLSVEAYKQFTIGIVEISGEVYFTTNHESSLDVLIRNIINDNGVVIKIRKENGIRYLDILLDDPSISNTIITLSRNLKTFKKTPNYATFCTKLLAIGADGLTFESINNGKNYVENVEAIEQFGSITKSFEWTYITSEGELLQKARTKLAEVLSNTYVSVEVTALDLNYIGLMPEEFNVSTKYLIENEVQNFSEVLKVVQLDLDLLAVWNSRLTFSNKPIISSSNATDVQQQVNTNRNETLTYNGRLTQKVIGVDERLEAYKEETDLAIVIIKTDVAEAQEDIVVLNQEVDVVGNAITNHANNINNPHKVTKVQIGLGNVDNTSDLNKPISTATQIALDAKFTDATYGVATTSANGLMSSTDKTKIDTIESNAEVNNISDINATDLTDNGDTTLHYHATDRNRTNHTGTQLASTISDFVATVRATILTGLSTTTNAIITATDTVLSGLGKLQKQVSDNLTTLTNHTGSTINPHSVTKTQVGLSNVDNTTDLLKPISTATQTALNLKISSSQKGVSNGVAQLDANGLVPSSQLPSYVNDILEYTSNALFPATGEAGIIYLNTTTNLTYRWSGTGYAEVSPSIALGETSSTAYAGDKGATTTSKLNTHTGNATIHITGAERTSWNSASTSTHTHTNKTVIDNTTASYTTAEQTKLSGIANNANNYVLPVATTVIGGVKSGTDITVDASGNVSVVDDSHNHIIGNVDGLQAILDGKVDDNQVLTNVPVGAIFTDTVTTINSKTGAISKADIVALGVPSQDTTYTVFTPTINGLAPLSGGGTTKYLRADGTWVIPPDTNTTYAIATTSVNGLMSSVDKTKLDGVTTGANKVIDSTTNGNILIDGVETNIYTHPTGTNPHGTTKTDVGLGSVDNTADSAKKVLSATKLTNARTLALSGDVSGSVSFDGSNNATIAATVADDSHNHIIDNVDGLATALSSKATQSTIDASINAIQIGGKNLLTDTKSMIGMTYKTAETFNGFAVVAKAPPAASYVDTYSKNTPILDGLEYTVSFYAKSTLESQNILCHFYNPNTTTNGKSSTGQISTAVDGGIQVSVTNTWKRYWVTWTQSVGGSSKSLIIGRVHSPGGSVSISAVKLEKGNKATDWTPAIEDVESSISLKVDKVTGKSLILDTEITRLTGISTGANNYTHPTTHPPAIIAQNSSNRFVSDTEKSTWNGKATQANIDNAIATLKQNGATRPTTNLFVGMVFFDTKLGKPIWCKTISPIAWVDSTGRNADATPGLYIN